MFLLLWLCRFALRGVRRRAFTCVLALVLVGGPVSSSLASESGRAYHARTLLNKAEATVDEAGLTVDDIEDLLAKTKYLQAWSDEGIPKILDDAARELGRIPPDYPRLLEVQKRMRALRARLKALEQRAQPLLVAYKRETDMTRFPEFEEDLRLTGIIAEMYRVSPNAFDQPMEVLEHVQQLHTVVGFVNGNAVRYAPLMNLKAPQGQRFDTVQRLATQGVRAFVTQWRAFGKKGPDHVREQVATANDALRQAEVVGGLAHVLKARKALRRAAAHLHVLGHAVGPSDVYDAASLQENFERARTSLDRVEGAVVEELTAQNRAPADAYTGQARAELESAVRVAWAQRSLRSEVLALRVHEADWRRFTGVRWRPEQNGWETFDHERLSITVVVRKDNRHATLHDVMLSRDPDTGRLDLQQDPVIRPRDMLLANL